MISDQTKPYALRREEGQRIQSAGALIRLMAASGQTGGTFNLLELACPAGYATSLEIHYAEDVAIYVLAGVLAVFWGSEKQMAGAGSFFYQPRGVPHGFRVEGGTAARILYLTFPAGLDRLILEQGAFAPDQPPAAAAARHKIECLGPLPE